MDTLAKAYWRHLAVQATTWATDYSIPIHAEGWQLWAGDVKIRDASKDNLYGIIHDPITIDCWIRRKRFPSEAAPMIDWPAHGKAFKSMKLGKRRRVSKHACKNCGVGTTLVKWKAQDDDACPRCGQSETTEHVIRCPQATDVWESELKTLQHQLSAIDTDPEIQDCIITSLTTWHAGLGHVRLEESQNPLLIQALTEQHSIGWFPFVEGLISATWQKAQAIHYSTINTKRTSQQWSHRLIQLIHTLTDNLWHHRNEIKHKTGQPRQKRMRLELLREVAKEFMIGPAGLPPGDSARFFNTSLMDLCQKDTHYKSAWLYQLAQARQRHKRKQLHDDEINTISLGQSRLFKWAKTGVAT
jgi:hypothetical protein